MDIQDTRRANLAEWLKTHSVPQREKSLFSQLKGGASFGERLARRLESDYSMGEGFLDRQSNTNSAKREEKRPLSAEAEQLISWIKRLDGLSDKAPEIFRHIADILALAHKGALTHNRPATRSLIDEEEAVRAIGYSDRDANVQHRTHKRPTKASG
ncbi:hypothetical protein [Caballeronia sp. ATUFL_M1_KS5A]|uniref:hypothetical protein n=1 Tax=Caballeronia sp. ATUFL_M1_KS5A TaxID=2921778 RepID=UPI0020292AFD|nr:hypothetical protein [Caballeronia sp. ATUFL_M1_KS5A]